MLIHKFTNFAFGEIIVQSNCLRFTYPKYFNDPFDSSIALIDQYIDFREIDSVEKMNYAINFFYKANPEILAQQKAFYGETDNDIKRIASSVSTLQKAKTHFTSVCSFSTIIEHILLWGHYADSHRGVALTFEVDEPNFLPYVENHKIMKGVVSYGFITEKINYFEQPEECYKRIFLTKSKDWKYESEFRILLADDDGLIQFTKSALKQITFGFKVNDDKKKNFIRMCERREFSNLKFNHVIQDNLELKVNPLPDDFAKGLF